MYFVPVAGSVETSVMARHVGWMDIGWSEEI